jgi:type I restriction enzyme, S subunit
MNVPRLRFNEFSGNWESKKISQILESVSEAVDVKDDNLYKQIGIRSHGKGIFHKELVTGKVLGNKRVFWIKENVFIVNIVFAWEQAVGKTTKNEVGMIASHRFPMYQPLNNSCSVDYIVFFF